MQLQHHIAQLLKNHNCVIVPGFGGFIGNYEPANADYTSHVFFPPAKRVLFNANLTQGDGLLANELMRAEGITYSEALEKITLFVNTCKKNLAAGERIELEETGFLFAQNGKVVFEQNRETNLWLDSYGLKQIPFIDFSIKRIAPVKVLAEVVTKEKEKELVHKAKEEAIIKKEDVLVIALDTESEIEVVEQSSYAHPSTGSGIASGDEEKIISIDRGKKKNKDSHAARNRRYKYLAAAVVLPVLFYSYWIPMKTDVLNTGKIQLGDFNPFRSQSGQLYDPRTSAFAPGQGEDWKSWETLTGSLPPDVVIYNYELDEETYIPVLLERENSATEPANTEGLFHIIANCFSVKRNAEKYVEELTGKGYKAAIVGQHNGLHRVSAGGYSSEAEAESALEAFKNGGNSGWILEP